MAKGAAWMIALRFAIRGTGLVSMIILARLLVPADFGLVAIATALAGALAAMSEFSFQVALIQNQAADRRHYDTAWTLGIIRGLVLAGALAAAPLRSLTSFLINALSRSSSYWLLVYSSRHLKTLLWLISAGTCNSIGNLCSEPYPRSRPLSSPYPLRSTSEIIGHWYPAF